MSCLFPVQPCINDHHLVKPSTKQQSRVSDTDLRSLVRIVLFKLELLFDSSTPESYFGVEKHSEARKGTQYIRLDHSNYLVVLLNLKRTGPPKGF